MENSKAYKYLFEQINASGFEKLDGYNLKIIEEIYEWEREEVEEVIWRRFHENKDVDLAKFLPVLKKYDGIQALKKALRECVIPSESSVVISQVLYEYTEDEQYLDIIMQNIEKEENKISNVAVLSYCKPCEKVYNLLIDIYLNNKNKTIRSTAVTGILYNKGIIADPLSLKEVMRNVELKRKFISDDMNERRKIIAMFENGSL